MKDVRRFIKYWIASLKDGDWPTISFAGESFHELSSDNLEDGKIPRETAEEIFAQADDSSPSGSDWVEVAICPVILEPIVERGSAAVGHEQVLGPFWIPAQVEKWSEDDDFATLSPTTKMRPWISREFLSPCIPGKPTVGSFADLDSYLESHELPSESWEKTLSFARELFQATVRKNHITDLEFLEYRPKVAPRLVLHRTTQGVNRSIRALHEEMQAKQGLELIEGVISQGENEPFELQDELMKRDPYLGHPVSAFPLTDAQRAAVLAATSLETGEVLAVNGPPGTGKTTLLQSLVASLWIDRALDRGEPPVILACSTNNRAVLNILDAFTLESDESDSITRRWLPAPASGYGMYFPAMSKAGEGETAKYPWVLQGPAPGGLPVAMETDEYGRQATRFFVTSGKARFSNLQTKENNLDQVKIIIDHLHETLRTEAESLRTLRAESFHLADLRSFWRAQGLHSVDEASAHFAERLQPVAMELENLQLLKHAVEKQISDIPLWLDLSAPFVAVLRDRRDFHLTQPFRQAQLTVPPLPARGFRHTLIHHVEDLERTARREHDEITTALASATEWGELEKRWSGNIRRLLDEAQARTDLAKLELDEDSLQKDPTRIDRLLDLTSRYRLFHLAARYWEGRWILELADTVDDDKKLRGQSAKNVKARFRRFSKITPLFVATFHQAPRIFNFYRGQKESLFGFVDLLIVDEAGQVSPEIGAATFGLAKRAVVVGDTAQIEPVRSVAPAPDFYNLQAMGLDPEASQIEAYSSSAGTIMAMAQQSTRFTQPGRTDGLWLQEHRRCVPEIISYCNDLVYQGLLIPKRDSISESKRSLPAMGHGHIRSKANPAGGSWVNPDEASVIAQWLKGRADELQRQYGKSLDKIVGIISPYKAQAAQIREALRRAKLLGDEGSEIAVGTVHKFQGGERPVILFSSTVTQNCGTRFMMDSGPNLLNVAVSRAKDSFLVFGDMGVFDSEAYSPSGKLARILFKEPGNAIPDLDSRPDLLRVNPRLVERINTLEGHREVLKMALETSQHRLLIVSPWISENAIHADGILEKIKDAKSRGLKELVVAYCLDFYDDDDSREKAKKVRKVREAATALRQSGAVVHELSRFHSKTLASDDQFLVEGSFNWLSASRILGGRYQRHEVSMRCNPDECVPKIEDAWQEILDAAG